MEISRDTTAGTEGTTSIRLRYSRQFQSSGHAHTIDAEATVAVGDSSEKREQIIRELEASVEQLARQITQHGTQPTEEAHPPTPVRSSATSQTALPRSAATAAQPTAPLPVSESMPTTPGSSGSRPISLPYFLDYIKKRWNMSGQEAMELLEVRELTGLNLREALFKLRDLKEPNTTQSSNTAQARTSQQPVVEAPRQTNRSTPTAPNSRPSASQAVPTTAPVTRAPGASAPRHESQPTSQAASTPPSAFAIAQEPRQTTLTRDGLPDFASTSKAPLPIQLGVVRDITSRPPYAFAEEDEEEDERDYELPTDQAGNEHQQAAESKMARLKELRTGNIASPERLNALNNVIGEQISEEQLGQIIKEISGSTNRKKLKIQQVEELISWAKEDYFAEEVNAILEPFDEEEE